MRQYKIFEHPSGLRESVKQGWSWPGAFFAPFWSLIKGLWMVAGVTWLIICVFNVTVVPPEMLSLCNIIMFIVFGVNGNKWRESNLASKGYKNVSMVYGANADGAIAAHLNKF